MPPYDLKPEFCKKCGRTTTHIRKLEDAGIAWIRCKFCDTLTRMQKYKCMKCGEVYYEGNLPNNFKNADGCCTVGSLIEVKDE